MRTLIPLLLLFVLAYAGWQFWEEYTAAPLQTQLLRTAAGEIEEVIITHDDDRNFRVFRTDDRWVVARNNQEIYDQGPAVEQLITSLTTLRTDSVLQDLAGPAHLTIELRSASGSERCALHFPATGPVRAQLLATGDVFALPPSLADELPRRLRFDHYRGGRTLRLAAARVDSLVVMIGDTLPRRPSPARLPLLLPTLLAPAPTPNADYFDEVADREKYFGTIHLYAGKKAHKITAYRDSTWAKPFVIVGEDFPLRPFALDSLW